MSPSMMSENRFRLIVKPLQNFELSEVNGVLSLIDRRSDDWQAISVEYPSHLKTARGCSELAGQPLIRAIGRRSKTVIDATAGMGQDSFMMAAFGLSVVGFERSEKVAALLANGLKRAMQDNEVHEIIGDRLQFIHANAIKELGLLNERPDAIYLDPMYPPKRKKSALAKKEMQILREIVGDDADTEELFSTALDVAKYRVVVKRPHHAEPIGNKPSMSYQGKLVRYDVYLTSVPENQNNSLQSES